jgi:hypothetical protein
MIWVSGRAKRTLGPKTAERQSDVETVSIKRYE